MPSLVNLLNISVEAKPLMGSTCNNCGYCCLMEVCPVGQRITGKDIGPCTLLVSEEGTNKHYCRLALSGGAEIKEDLGIGVGCCAETQKEAIARITGQNR